MTRTCPVLSAEATISRRTFSDPGGEITAGTRYKRFLTQQRAPLRVAAARPSAPEALRMGLRR